MILDLINKLLTLFLNLFVMLITWFFDLFADFAVWFLDGIFSLLNTITEVGSDSLQILGYLDIAFPVTHFFALLSSYVTFLIITTVYRAIKAWIPTVSG